jgi:excisionase family DNA binding protein
MSYVTPKEAAKKFKVTQETVRRWAISGKIKYTTTEGGHRRYLIKDEKKDQQKQRIIYARVSSKKQEGNLDNQIKFLKTRYPEHALIQDIGSGINYKRKGFKTILEGVFKGNIDEVVVSFPDRFSRFGFDMFQWIFEQHGAKLITYDSTKKSLEQDFAEDLMSIITVFSARYHGKRSYNKVLQKAEVLSESDSD